MSPVSLYAALLLAPREEGSEVKRVVSYTCLHVQRSDVFNVIVWPSERRAWSSTRTTSFRWRRPLSGSCRAKCPGSWVVLLCLVRSVLHLCRRLVNLHLSPVLLQLSALTQFPSWHFGTFVLPEWVWCWRGVHSSRNRRRLPLPVSTTLWAKDKDASESFM